MAEILGVDIGGSAIKLGRFLEDGTLLEAASVPTPQPSVPGAVTMAIEEAVRQLDPDGRAGVVGIGVPGPTDARSRVARIAINLPGWEDVPLVDWLEPRLNRPVTLMNDASCALMGESWLGAARGCRDVLLLTLGTGVGGAVMLDGRLFLGAHGAAAEPGLICIDPEGPACNSGNRGSLEQFCSIGGLRRLCDRSPDRLAADAAGGDSAALAAWREYGRRLGIGLSSLVYVLTPSTVLLGGGLSGAIEHFLPSLQQELETRVLAVSRQGLSIRRCALGNGAGRLGAAWVARERFLRGTP
ncbi:ROK family protein [Synechococcus sp. RSCCF101]|uniref:ROK family protein n=1 Tax=Synechococcus sp. RSCCF101 TaxID=2511069 RepID=UPI0012460C5A|nr:ROK family protein [Synechococcus sp. RSCCF101]QEY31416.1 ROK family protein [Synechococcus sp. RSCCF101]